MGWSSGGVDEASQTEFDDHSARHEAGGADALAIDAAAGTGSLRTLGTGAQQAAAGNDSRLTDARTPTAHLLRGDKHTDSFKRTGALYETIPRSQITGSSNLISQQLYMVGIELPADLVVTSITFMSGSAALVTGAHQFFGLFNSARVLLRGTPDDTSGAWAANSEKPLNLTSAFTTTYAGLHYLGVLVEAATPPSLQRAAAVAAVMALPPVWAGSSDSGASTLPATAAAITGGAFIPYAYVS